MDTENCPCKKVLECDWAKNLFQLLRQFDVTDPLRVKAIALMRKDVCKTAVRKIKCCDTSKENIKDTNVGGNVRVQVHFKCFLC